MRASATRSGLRPPAKAARTITVSARVDSRLKRSAEKVFTTLGISTTEAVRLFLRQVELHDGLPFPTAIPNAETLAAMKEAENPSRLEAFGSFRELRAKL